MKATKHRECVTVAPFVVKPTTQKRPPSLRGGHAGTLHERRGQASRSFRPTPHTKIWCNFVLSCFVRTLAYGTWLRSLINAPCLPGVDSGDPVRKQTRHHVACTAREGTLLWILAKLLVHALVSGLESIRAFPSRSSHGIMSDFCKG